jgi:hypothetical protein
LRLRRELVALDGVDPAYQAGLSAGCTNLGLWRLNFAQTPQGRSAALDLLREAAAAAERVSLRLPGVAEHVKALRLSHQNLAVAAQALNKDELAEESLLSEARAADWLARRFPGDPASRPLFVESVERVVGWYRQQGRPAAGRDFLDRTVAAWRGPASDPAAQATLKSLRDLQRKYP